MGKPRLRYIQLVRDVHKTLAKEKAIELIKESESFWENSFLEHEYKTVHN